MPRLSNKHYLATRLALKRDPVLRHALDLDDLLSVARFYAFTTSFTDEEALAYRRHVSATDPSLPNRVGKILRRPTAQRPPEAHAVAREVAAPDPDPEPVLIGRGEHRGRLVVRGVPREQVDLRRLAQVLQSLVDEDVARQDNQRDAA